MACRVGLLGVPGSPKFWASIPQSSSKSEESSPKLSATGFQGRSKGPATEIVEDWPVALGYLAFQVPGKPVAYTNGLLSINYGLLWGSHTPMVPAAEGSSLINAYTSNHDKKPNTWKASSLKLWAILDILWGIVA